MREHSARLNAGASRIPEVTDPSRISIRAQSIPRDLQSGSHPFHEEGGKSLLEIWQVAAIFAVLMKMLLLRDQAGREPNILDCGI
jgi:hypothetical protein